MLTNGMSGNVNNELRVRNVNDLNDLHAINGLGTNDDMMDLWNEVRVSKNANSMPENLNVYVRSGSNIGT